MGVKLQQYKLHEAMQVVLLEQPNFTGTTRFLSDEIGRRGLYVRGDGATAPTSQIAARARNYPHLFEILDNRSIRLIGNGRSKQAGRGEHSAIDASNELATTPDGKQQRKSNLLPPDPRQNGGGRTLSPRKRRDESMRKVGLAPVMDEHTEVLILGTLPGDESLSKGQYYAKPNNDFWKLLGAALNERLTNMPYETKVRTLLARRVGLWDVYHNCVRPGSMDKDISERELNDFKSLKTVAPRVRLVCFNGQEAGESEEPVRGLGYRTRVLPSSSGANRKNQDERLRSWKSIAL
ncbi:MAG TPA: DNA-deoxyinosine glycosylase [Terriglobales bacterium]|nr:DNA-deoxyinosine glycosylase [Terriglobales bacterium]